MLLFSVSLQYPQFEQSVMSSCPLHIQITRDNTWQIVKLSFRTVLLPFFLPPQPNCRLATLSLRVAAAFLSGSFTQGLQKVL